MVTGIALIAIMIIVGNSLPQDGRSFYGSSGKDIVNYTPIWNEDECCDESITFGLGNEIDALPAESNDVVVTIYPDDEDSAKDDVSTLTFSHGLKLTLDSEE
jgi:hypothetical protein